MVDTEYQLTSPNHGGCIVFGHTGGVVVQDIGGRPAIPDVHVSCHSVTRGDHVIFDDPPPPPPPPEIYQNFPVRKAAWSGVAQILIGAVCITCQVLIMHFNEEIESHYPIDRFFNNAAGVWCGCFFAVVGAWCVVSAWNRNRKFIFVCFVLSIFSCIIFCLSLSIISCLGLTIIQTSNLYPCQYEQFGNGRRKICNVGSPMLIAQITMLMATIMQMIISFKMAVQSYKTILKKKEDQFQFIRTPEGELVVLNKGPDFSSRTVRLQRQILDRLPLSQYDILSCPIQKGAILKPPPYAMDEKGEQAAPPGYREPPPLYCRSTSLPETSLSSAKGTPNYAVKSTQNEKTVDESSEFTAITLVETGSQPPDNVNEYGLETHL